MNRRFERIVMRVTPTRRRRSAAGARTVDLAQWGNRAIVLEGHGAARAARRERGRRQRGATRSPPTAASHGGAIAAGVEVISAEKQAELIREYDTESNFRKLVGPVGLLVTTLAVILSSFHIYTAGFGLLVEIKHRTFHLSLVLALIFLVFPRPRLPAETKLAVRAWLWGAAFASFYVYLAWDLVDRLTTAGELRNGWPFLVAIMAIAFVSLPFPQFRGHDDRTSWTDWPLALAAAATSLYFLAFFDDIFIKRVGSPIAQDYMMGVLAIVMVMEATRRTMGPLLPLIGMTLPALRAARPLHAGHPRPPRLFGPPRGQPHLHRHRGHLRHRGRRRRDLRVPFRAVRRAGADDRPRSPVHGPGDDRRGALFRRPGEGLRRVVRPLRDDLGLGRRQRRDHRLAHDSADEEVRLLAALRGGSRGVRVVRRSGHAAGDGRVRVRDGRAPRRAVQGARDHRHHSGAVPLLRLPVDGAFRSEAIEARGRRAASHPEARPGDRRELAPRVPADRARHDAAARLHAVPRGVLGHRALLRLLLHSARRAQVRLPRPAGTDADVGSADRRARGRRKVRARRSAPPARASA